MVFEGISLLNYIIHTILYLQLQVTLIELKKPFVEGGYRSEVGVVGCSSSM